MNSKNMRKLAAALGTVALLALPLPAMSGLGPAENIKKEFDAWCAKTKNECKVTFSGDTLSVDNNNSISKSELQRYETINRFYCVAASGLSSSKCYGKATTLIYYNQNGKEGVGAIIFVDDTAFFEFQIALKVFCGSQCRPVGPDIKATF